MPNKCSSECGRNLYERVWLNKLLLLLDWANRVHGKLI
jgi:hypothetical protein